MNRITVTCFAASYAVALAFEVSRLFFRSGVRGALMLTFAGAGLLAHSLYLAARLTWYGGGPVSGWFEWFLLAAWILAATYIYLTCYHPRNPIGLFVLPLVLALIAVGYLFRSENTFAGDARLWGLVHGFSLLMGTVVVLIGFVAGLMYLIEANRLKHKRPPAGYFRLPSLEWAERVNGRTLVFSTILLGIGVLSGLALNAINHSKGASALPWTDPVVWSSGLLLAWLLAAATLNSVYRPARRGRKVAYLTVASMIFLLLALGVILLAPSKHPSQQALAENEPATYVCRDAAISHGNHPPRFRFSTPAVAVMTEARWYSVIPSANKTAGVLACLLPVPNHGRLFRNVRTGCFQRVQVLRGGVPGGWL